MTNQEAIEILERMETNEFDNPIKCDRAIDKAIEALRAGWISVKDRLPEESGRYLVYAKEGERETHRTIAPFQKAFHLSGRMAYWKVTHWMPLPEPPKEG